MNIESVSIALEWKRYILWRIIVLMQIFCYKSTKKSIRIFRFYQILTKRDKRVMDCILLKKEGSNWRNNYSLD